MDKYKLLRISLLFIMQYEGLLSQGVELTLVPSVKEVQRTVNESLIITCLNPGTAKELYWKSPSNEKIISNKGRIHVEQMPLGLAVIFDSIERNDKGNYTCNAVVGETKMRIAFTLVTIKPISFRGTPDVQNATENINVLIKCEVDGDPEPNVFWLINGTTPPEGSRYLATHNGLHITNVTLNDRGMYECRAMQMTTNYADMNSKKILLKVFHKPKWKVPDQKKIESAYGYLSGVVNLTCEAIAEPEPQFTWRRNNEVIFPEHHNATVINEPQRSILQLPVHNESIFGEYKCEASNSIGRVERIITLQQGVKPNPPTEINPGGTKVHTADVKISDQRQEGIIGYRVQFVVKQPGIQHNWNSPEYQDFMIVSGGSSMVTIIDLLENTEYAVRVASRNAAGLSDYSEEIRLRTKSSTTNDVFSINQCNYSIQLIIMLYITFLIH